MEQRKRKRIQNRISRSWFRPLLMRRLFVMVLMALQIWCLAYLVQSETLAAKGLRLLLPVVSWVLVLYIVTHKDKGAYKVAWVTLVLAFPLLGGILYLLCSFQASTRKFKRQILRTQTKYRSQYLLPGDALDAAAQSLPPLQPSVPLPAAVCGFSGV